MPKRKKKLIEKTTEEVIGKLFPKKVREKAKKEARKKEAKSLIIKG